jgi:hypothetical protein
MDDFLHAARVADHAQIADLVTLAERRGEQLRQSDLQIERLRDALEQIADSGNAQIAAFVLDAEWG